MRARQNKSNSENDFTFRYIIWLICLIFYLLYEKVKKNEETKKVQIVDEQSNSRPYGVVINNYPGAIKVHSGLDKAYIVYEFPIEGGISRSLALFKDVEDVKVGTVRSARQYHIDYALENDAIFVHFGWNHPAQDKEKNLGIDYIDLFLILYI